MTEIEGRQPVLELFRSGEAINKLLVAKGERHGSIHKILQLAKQNQVIVQEVNKDVLDRISQTQAHQGVIAYISPVSYMELDALLSQNSKHFYLVLDGIQDPHNFGSLLRTAEACGVTGVIIPKRRAVPVTAVVAKASAGAVSHVPICRENNIVTVIKRLKENGCWIAGADMDGQACYQQDLSGNLGLVIGSEGKGISRLVKEHCDYLIRIPMCGKVGSLNAAVAGGILLYEIIRQQNA